MNGMALIGILLIVYAAAVVVLAIKKPAAIWDLKKIKMFEKFLGKKGTIVFFYIWALIAFALGIWFLIG